MIKTLTLAVLSLTLVGCVNLGEKNSPSVVYYTLNDEASVSSGPAHALRDNSPTLLVLGTTSGGFYDNDQLVFSRSPGTRGQYQFARWTERPGKRFADLMRARLDRQGDWRVTAASGYVRGDLLLDTELVELYHDAASMPGQVRLVLRVELVDLKQRKLLGRRVFEQQVPLATFDATGAAQASSQAVSRALDELSVWLTKYR